MCSLCLRCVDVSISVLSLSMTFDVSVSVLSLSMMC